MTGDLIKQWRKNANLSVQQATELLNAKGISISEKTLYGWESGRRQPDADVFLELCKIYGISSFHGIEKSPAPESEADAGEKELVNNYRSMNAAGRESLVSLSGDMVASGRYATDKPHIAYIAAEGSGPEKIKITDEVKKAFDELETDI